ncbi:protein FAM163B [Clupea harengus]|uniref:Protein FAM163B n=1 Tax=Clupea harengus TaxID=7950 RepID=A0A6P3W694_CLUHA|nr:protein FAM163B [Clupea harengus]
MTAGTVVITGGILATVILLCIIAVLCYCRLQYYCCKKEESESEEEEPDFAVTSRLPPVHSNHNLLAASAATATATHGIGVGGGGAIATANGPVALFTPPVTRKLTRSHTFCPSCTSRYELPFYLQPPEGLRNGGERLSYRAVQQQELQLPVEMPVPRYAHPQALHPQSLHPQALHPLASASKLNLTRSVTMREMFTRSCSISTDV